MSEKLSWAEILAKLDDLEKRLNELKTAPLNKEAEG